ncbi:unnamed protein product, partial [Rotaria magnacalcarata]
MGNEDGAEQTKIIQQVNYPAAYMCDDDGDETGNGSSSASSSYLPRVRTGFMENMNLNENDRIQQWLNDGVIDNVGDDAARISDNLRPTESSNKTE